MKDYCDVIMDNKKTRIPYKTHNMTIWLDLKRVLVAIGYASYTTHQEKSLIDSGTFIRFYNKRPYADARALRFLHDNITMPALKKYRVKEIIAELETKDKQALESAIGFSLEEQPEATEYKSAGGKNRPTRIYIAGRMRYSEFKPIEYGNAPECRALLGVALDKSYGKDEIYREGAPVDFWFGTEVYTYVGPFFLGNNHGCFDENKYHMVDICSYGEVTQRDVVDVCTRQIASADLVFAWLGSDSHEAHGTLTEIGYAKGLGKPVIVASTPSDSKETWFAKFLADSWMECEDFLSAFRAALIQYEISKE